VDDGVDEYVQPCVERFAGTGKYGFMRFSLSFGVSSVPPFRASFRYMLSSLERGMAGPAAGQNGGNSCS
jgi:hypothetical protein